MKGRWKVRYRIGGRKICEEKKKRKVMRRKEEQNSSKKENK